MMVIRWVVCLVGNIVMLILAYLLAPLLPVFATKDGRITKHLPLRMQPMVDNWLPGWLWWFQTPKYPITGNSDWRYNRRHWRHDKDVDTHPFKVWWNKVSWLLRNPSYGFDTGPIAFKAENFAIQKVYGDEKTTNQQSGYLYRILTNPGGARAWQLFYVHHWNGSHFLRINLGWKLWDYAQEARLLQFVCSISLWKQYL